MLTNYLNALLQSEHFSDYCSTILQVEDRPEINRISTDVTASMALLHAALQANADAIFVHHGYFGAVKLCQSLALKGSAFNFMTT